MLALGRTIEASFTNVLRKLLMNKGGKGAGPFVAVAAICENVIEGKDGVLSLIRLVDRQMIVAQGPEAPDSMPPQKFNFFLVISLKAGAARGRQTVKFSIEEPSGVSRPLQTLPVLFESADRGQNLVIKMDMTLEQEGLYWFDVELNGRVLTRIPFRLIYQQVSTG